MMRLMRTASANLPGTACKAGRQQPHELRTRRLSREGTAAPMKTAEVAVLPKFSNSAALLFAFFDEAWP